MSSYVNFYTFEQMDNATVQAVSSEAIGHPAEHALTPLEPNMAWEANEASAQHELEIDLGAAHECSCLFWIHHETEATDPATIGITLEVHWSHDSTNWTQVAPISGDTGVTEKLLKVLTFSAITARYWKIVFKGTGAPFYYAPSDMRVSAMWLGTYHALDVGPALPLADKEDFPVQLLTMPYGRSFTTGGNVNSMLLFDRTWLLREASAEWSTLLGVIAACNGAYRPFVYTEGSADHLLCWFNQDKFDETLVQTNLFMLSVSIAAVPLVQRDEYH